MGQLKVMQNPETLHFLQQQAVTAQYVTSVCTGSLILAAAGLLRGYKATCHWAFRDQLAQLGVAVIPDRVVVDRNRVTVAGVTSGLDFGLTLVGLVCGEDTAKIACGFGTAVLVEDQSDPRLSLSVSVPGYIARL